LNPGCKVSFPHLLSQSRQRLPPLGLHVVPTPPKCRRKKSCRRRAEVIHTWGQRDKSPPPLHFPSSAPPPCTASPHTPALASDDEGNARSRQASFAISKILGLNFPKERPS